MHEPCLRAIDGFAAWHIRKQGHTAFALLETLRLDSSRTLRDQTHLFE